MYVVDRSISVDVGMGGVVGRETHSRCTADGLGTGAIHQYPNTIKVISVYFRILLKRGKCLVPKKSKGANANPGEGNQCGETSC